LYNHGANCKKTRVGSGNFFIKKHKYKNMRTFNVRANRTITCLWDGKTEERKDDKGNVIKDKNGKPRQFHTVKRIENGMSVYIEAACSPSSKTIEEEFKRLGYTVSGHLSTDFFDIRT
jgi:hypothetical protein